MAKGALGAEAAQPQEPEPEAGNPAAKQPQQKREHDEDGHAHRERGYQRMADYRLGDKRWYDGDNDEKRGVYRVGAEDFRCPHQAIPRDPEQHEHMRDRGCDNHRCRGRLELPGCQEQRHDHGREESDLGGPDHPHPAHGLCR